MPRASTNYVANANWGSEEKRASRCQTIIAPHRKFFGESIPADKQHWTLCGAHFNEDGPIEGELSHLVSEGLLQPNQFRGVDKEPDIIVENKQIHPDIDWREGDFRSVMLAASQSGEFDPAIINYDGVMELRFGIPYLARLFWFINDNVLGDLLFSVSMIMKSSYRQSKEKTGEQFIDALERELGGQYRDHWRMVRDYYYYPGANNARTVMGIFTFVKRGHSSKYLDGRLDTLQV